jgi:methionyl-tRNA formyltransferase
LVGGHYFGAAVFVACRTLGHRVVGVASPDSADQLTRAAWDAVVPWQPDTELTPAHVPPATDLILAVHCHRYLPAAFRARAHLGALGYHPSLLPRHRGKQAIEATLAAGDGMTGGTWYWLDDGWDTGTILLQAEAAVPAGATAAGLWRGTLAPLGLRTLDRALQLAAGAPGGLAYHLSEPDSIHHVRLAEACGGQPAIPNVLLNAAGRDADERGGLAHGDGGAQRGLPVGGSALRLQGGDLFLAEAAGVATGGGGVGLTAGGIARQDGGDLGLGTGGDDGDLGQFGGAAHGGDSSPVCSLPILYATTNNNTRGLV